MAIATQVNERAAKRRDDPVPASRSVGRTAARTISPGERQILVRIDGGINISEAELRYQLDRKDGHPLASDPRLLDVLADLETHGLIESRLQFKLSDRGRAELPVDDESRST